jgi:integrase
MFRHTFCAAALQLLDGDAPIGVYTVARWMGHEGSRLVERTYSHLGEVRHRSKVLEFRADQHAAILGDRLRAVTGSLDGSVAGTPAADRVS